MLLGIIFLNTELQKNTFLRDEMICMAWFATNKTKHKLIGIFRAPVVTEFIEKI